MLYWPNKLTQFYGSTYIHLYEVPRCQWVGSLVKYPFNEFRKNIDYDSMQLPTLIHILILASKCIY